MRARRLPSGVCGVAAGAEGVERVVLEVVVDSMRPVVRWLACLPGWLLARMMPGSQLAAARSWTGLGCAKQARQEHPTTTARCEECRPGHQRQLKPMMPIQGTHRNKHAYLDVKRQHFAIYLDFYLYPSCLITCYYYTAMMTSSSNTLQILFRKVYLIQTLSSDVPIPQPNGVMCDNSG